MKNLDGLIPILAGIYGILLAKGVLPRKTDKPQEWVQWRQKFGGMMMICAPVAILFGLAQLFGMFDR